MCDHTLWWSVCHLTVEDWTAGIFSLDGTQYGDLTPFLQKDNGREGIQSQGTPANPDLNMVINNISLGWKIKWGETQVKKIKFQVKIILSGESLHK